ncbi:MAG: hypothetical protein K5871_02050 [Lachnospiraceae bacterium]|nr:hypothetical protein [Lachnospiraceae bacterium]
MSIFSRKTEVQEPLIDHTVYLIDTENVRTVWTMLLDRMTVNDKIYVFYTMNSGNVSYEDLNGVISSGKSVELIQCHTGKNGLDFQLVSYLGYLIRNNENADYCIISDDSGYDAVIKFWEGRDVDVTRKTAFQVSGKPAKAPKKSLFGVKKPTARPGDKPTVTKPDADKASTAKPASEKTQNSKASSDKTAADKAQTAKTAADKAQTAKQASEKSQTAKTASEKTQRAKTAADKQAADKAQAAKPASDKSHNAKASSDESQSPKPETAKARTSGQSADKTPAVKPELSGTMDERLKTLFPDESDEMITQISEIIRKSGGKKGLAEIHDEIEKLYRNEKASDIYRAIRHNFKDIYC